MRLTVLDDAQLQRIHDASCEILAEVGVHIPHDDMRSRFRAAGATADDSTGMVRIPEALVMSSLETAGKSFTLYGRDRAKRAVFGEGKRNYNSISGEALWIDDVTGERRYAALEDAVTASRLGDALPDLTIAGAMCDPHELPVSYRCVEVAAAQLRHTTKPIGFWFYDRASAVFLNELFVALAGSEEEAASYPVTYPFMEPISPLRFPHHGVDLLYETAKLNLPVPIGPMCQAGMSGPVTLAGTLAVENAEILAGICITQLIRAGMPVCYGGIPHAFDMRTTQLIFCGPEQALMAVAMAQMGKRYGLPVYINVGLTDSKTPDAQAGMEAGVTLACGALAGADIFGHLGICGVDQASSLDMLVMQHELIGFVERLMRSFEVNDETLALDVVKEVGSGGTFMDHEHTAAHFRQELWFPKLLDRRFYDAWAAGGKVTMAERCRQEKERLLATHQPEPLPDDLEQEFQRITAAARKHLG
jgi:trimethylamine--corrinoid protein Co-methyltransferase